MATIGTYLRRHHIALLALFVALGGTSFAATNALGPKNSVGTAQVVNGSLQKVDLSKAAATALKGNAGTPGAAGAAGATGAIGPAGPAATTLWAVINADGTKSRGSRVTASSVTFPGGYSVQFDTNVAGCAYVASVGSPTTGADVGEATVAQRLGDANAVFVRTGDSAGAAAAKPFYLAVFC